MFSYTRNHYDHRFRITFRDYIESDSQLVVNGINDRACVLENIIDLVEDIRYTTPFFQDIKIEYSNRLINMETDAIAKVAHY